MVNQGVGERTIARRVRKNQALPVYRKQIVIIHDNVVPCEKLLSLCDVLGKKYGLARALVSTTDRLLVPPEEYTNISLNVHKCLFSQDHVYTRERLPWWLVVECSTENSARHSSSCLCVASSRLLLSS